MGAGAPGSARIARRWLGRSKRPRREWARLSSRRSADGSTACAREHGVPVVAAGAQMDGDPLALEKDLYGSRGQPHLDFAAGEAIRDAVEVAFEHDMVVDADPTHAPLGKAIGLCRQRGEVRAIQLFEEDLPGDTEPPDRALIIELAE